MSKWRSLPGRYVILAALLLAVHLPSASAQEGACKPQKSVRYLDVDVAVSPPSGPADRAVTLSARCLPADRPVIIWSGQEFDAVRPVSTGSIDSAGSFVADATVPADAEPGKSYYFAIMIDDHVVGTGSFTVDGEEGSAVQ
jgi:hypothetical protein